MAFKGLEDRFTAKAKQLYNHDTAHHSGPNGTSDEPFIEVKPNDPSRNLLKGDTRLVPLGSIQRDFTRLSRYLKTTDGMMFLVKEAFLQSGNRFSETRIFNPVFVIGNTQPYVHIRRPLAVASNFSLNGDLSQKSPGSDVRLGRAGRLQQQTSKDAISRVAGSNPATGLLSLLSPLNLVNQIADTFSLKNNGTLDINQRPELNVNGQYYSVLLWRGFHKQNSVKSNLDSAAANLRTGNIKGAYNALKSGVHDVINGARDIGSALGLGEISPKLDGRSDDSSRMAGRRYFIKNATEVDGYFKAASNFTGFLNRQPYVLSEGQTPTYLQVNPPNLGTLRSLNNSINSAMTMLNVAPIVPQFDITKLAVTDEGSANPAEDQMRFKELSLANRYNTSDHLAFVRQQLEEQKQKQFTYWKEHKNRSGIQSPDAAGTEQNINPRQRRQYYIRDTYNQVPFITQSGTDGVSDNTRTKVRKLGEDYVTVMFFDYVNKTTIPFRAFISNVSEAVTPQFSDNKYIGRIERNVVYVGVQRELSFQLRVHALSEAELDVVWQKVNYLTGLCFPAKYFSGYMVPPLVKLTMGDLYRDQPGYIRSLTHTIEDGTSWEITEGRQVPHGVVMNISFVTLEKSQMRTTSSFYPFELTARAAMEARNQQIANTVATTLPTIPVIRGF